MTILGKLLLFVNLLAAGAFMYFATLDYHGEKGKGNGRQAIAAAGLKHILLVSGLPLGADAGDLKTVPADPEDEIPFKIEMAGGFKTDSVGKKFLESYFKEAPPGDVNLGGAAASPVPNQIAEVERTWTKIDESLKAIADKPADQLKLLEGWLLVQVETFDERVAVQDLIKAGKADELQKLLKARFDAVINAPKPPDDAINPLVDADIEDVAKNKEKIERVAASRLAPLNDGERRTKIAHLLVHLASDAAWQKRVMVVVGLRKYVAVVSAQADRFRDMATRVEVLIPADQAGYFGAERIDLQLAIDRTDLANQQADLKKKKTDQFTKETDFVGQRSSQLAKIELQLAKTKAEVENLLVKQGNIETALFEIQREVAITLDEVYRLEGVLIARERELLRAAAKSGKN